MYRRSLWNLLFHHGRRNCLFQRQLCLKQLDARWPSIDLTRSLLRIQIVVQIHYNSFACSIVFNYVFCNLKWMKIYFQKTHIRDIINTVYFDITNLTPSQTQLRSMSAFKPGWVSELTWQSTSGVTLRKLNIHLIFQSLKIHNNYRWTMMINFNLINKYSCVNQY